MTPIRNIPEILLASNELTIGPFWNPILRNETLKIVREPNLFKILERFHEKTPDLIVLDVSPITEKEFRLIKDLREESVAPIILLATALDEKTILRTYHEGVDDCILKPLDPLIFQAKIIAWLRYSKTIFVDTLPTLRVGKVHLFSSQRMVIVGEKDPIRLTNLEMRFLFSLLSKPDCPILTTDLIHQMWGYGISGDMDSLKNVAYRVRKKLEADPSHPEMIVNISGIGYLFKFGGDQPQGNSKD